MPASRPVRFTRRLTACVARRRRTFAALAVTLYCLPAAAASPCEEHGFTDTVITPEPGVELFARSGGAGERTVIVPADFLLFEALCPLAASHRVVFYDMRNRGRSGAVEEGSRLTLEADVRDLEAVRHHFAVESAALVGYSYLGKLVVLYALEHPRRVERLVQLGAVAMDPGRTFPPELTASWEAPADAVAALRAQRADGLHERDPRAYCEAEWEVLRPRLVGDPARAAALPGTCHLNNEHPTSLAFHFEHHFRRSALQTVVTPAQAARVTVPVLTVHGTLDRNAPYAGGREWAALLPQARLLTLDGAAHAVATERDLLPDLAAFLGGRWPAAAEILSIAAEGQLSQLLAVDLLRAALAHHRPTAAPVGRHLRLQLAGALHPRSQAARPDPPFERFPVQQDLTLDPHAPAGPRLAVVEELTWPNFVSRYRVVAGAGAGPGSGIDGFEVDLASGREVTPYVPPAQTLHGTLRRLPPLLLPAMLAEAPGTLRCAGVRREGEAWRTVVTGVHGGERLDLQLAEDGSVAVVARLVDEPMLGDAWEVMRLEGETRAGDWRLPARVVREVAGIGSVADLTVTAASWEAADEALFAPPPRPAAPDAGAASPPGAATPPEPTEPATALEPLAPGVWLAPVPGSPGYVSLVVERPDHLVLVEAPLGERPVAALLEVLAARFPGKPLRWVVASHHHFDHSGGVPAAMASGATLVTTPGNARFFRRALTGPRTLADGAEVRSAAAPALELVGERLAIPGGPPEVVALRVPPNLHAAEMLAVWLPAAGLLFQADLLRFPLTGDGAPRPQAAALLALLDAAGIAEGTILGAHGDRGTVAELRAALAGE